MNPFTRFLAQFSSDHRLAELVSYWDRLETLIVTIYKSQKVTETEEIEYAAVREWLEGHYPQWADELRPHWQQARVAGERVSSDPFRALFTPETAESFVKNWPAMQLLPAAREALNNLILQRST